MTGGSRTVTWLGVILAVSLAVNFFFIGFMVARISHPAALPPARQNVTIDRLMSGLSAPSRAEVRRVFKTRKAEIGRAMRRLGRARRAAAGVFGAQDYDPVAARGALEQVRLAGAAVQAALHEAILEAAAGLPAHDRRMLMRMAARAAAGRLHPPRRPPAARQPAGGPPPEDGPR
jgi:uncharacterized membrane protein